MTESLIDRLEAAPCGSRELDALIWAHFRPERIKVLDWRKPYGDCLGKTQVEFTLPPKRTSCVTSDRGTYAHAEPVTTSIDAAVALVERELPGWTWMVDGGGRSPSAGVIIGESLGEDDGPDPAFTGKAKAPPLAICAALLRAKGASS